jgi:hypothetical protein
MRKDKRRRLEQAGWTIGDTGDFLELSEEERQFIEAKLALAAGLRRQREHLGLTRRLKSPDDCVPVSRAWQKWRRPTERSARTCCCGRCLA